MSLRLHSRFFSLAAGLLSVAAVPAAGQDRITDHNAHGWYMYFGDHAFGDSKWGTHLELQARRHDVLTKWQQLLPRPGVNYTVNRHLMLTAGYALARTWPYGESPVIAANNEHRIWEQALIRYTTGKASWITRLRFENRFIPVLNGETGERERYRYENRFRMLQQIRVPVRGKLYVTAYDEFWTYVKPYVSNSLFDQNRAYGAVGVALDSHWRFEAGYMNQALLQRSGRVLESNHTLMISLISTAPFRR